MNNSLNEGKLIINFIKNLSVDVELLLNLFLEKAKENLLKINSKLITISLDEIREVLSIDDNNNLIKDKIGGLLNLNVEYWNVEKKINSYSLFYVFSEIEIKFTENIVIFGLSQKFQEILCNPDKNQELYLYIVKNIKSKYSIMLYKFIDNMKNDKIEINLVDFKNLLGLDNEKYSMMSMFRARVLEKAKEEINKKTDFNFNYKLIKQGRKFEKIEFSITK